MYELIQSTGLRYTLFMDYGESYTHAAAVVLDVPVASNDHAALVVAQVNGLSVHEPVLSTFDLVTFALQTELLSTKDCETIRKKLLAEAEPLPPAFRHSSFQDGLPNFFARLVDGSRPLVGCQTSTTKWDKRITVVASES
jgi:hypothetical protein